jgi:hypothetical protein
MLTNAGVALMPTEHWFSSLNVPQATLFMLSKQLKIVLHDEERGDSELSDQFQSPHAPRHGDDLQMRCWLG